MTYMLDRINQISNAFSYSVQSDSGYPYYNIVQEAKDVIVLEIATAGFFKSELSVVLEKGQLVVEGRKADVEKSAGEQSAKYLHKGISTKAFRRKFAIHDHLEVQDISYNNGILRIEMKVVVPEEEKPKHLTIK